MKKVFEVVASLSVGGAERVALEIAAGIGKRHAAEFQGELCVVGPSAADATAHQRSTVDEAKKRGVGVHCVEFSSVFDPASRKRLAALLRSERVDLVQIHNRPRDWQVASVCRLLGVPVLYTIHKQYTHDKLATRILYSALARTVQPIICVSKAVAAQIRRQEFAPESSIRVIYNGIRTDLFQKPSPELREAKRAELGWSAADFVWLCAGRLSPEKGPLHLLDAMARLPSDSRSRLVLAGEGPLETQVRERVQRLNLGQRVSLLGPRTDVAALLGAADAYANSSHQEGHPLSLLEAMAAELPIVAPRLPSIEEIAAPGAPVFYGPRISVIATSHDPAQIAEAFIALERNPESARLAAHLAREHVARRFSSDTMLDEYASLYTEVLRRGPGVNARLAQRLGSLSRAVD